MIDSAQNLCVKIKEDAAAQAAQTVDAAKVRAQQMIAQAQEAADREYADILSAAKVEAVILEKRLLSTIGLETRRITLAAREQVVDLVFTRIKERGAQFRLTSEYRDYLKTLAIEGIVIIDCDQIELVAAVSDKAAVNEQFLQEVSRVIKDKYAKEVGLTLVVEDGDNDIGILVRSKGQRIIYDNRFAARLGRAREEIRTAILKEAFGENV